jgi:hypothetical protein
MTHTIQPSNPETTPATETTDIPATRPGTGVAAAAAAVPAALKRRIPKYSDLAPLMQFKKPEFSKEARLKRASTVWELRDIAKRRTPRLRLTTPTARRRPRSPCGVPARRSWTSSSAPASCGTCPVST